MTTYTLNVPGKADRTFKDFRTVVAYATREAARLRHAGRLEDARAVTIIDNED